MWKCSCVAGYTGLRCETKMDLCANNTCAVSLSTCQPMPQTLNYTCNCSTGERWVIWPSVVLTSISSTETSATTFILGVFVTISSIVLFIQFFVWLWLNLHVLLYPIIPLPCLISPALCFLNGCVQVILERRVQRTLMNALRWIHVSMEATAATSLAATSVSVSPTGPDRDVMNL